MTQEIKKIHIKDLVLWTENPRNPIRSDATDQGIADRAISQDNRRKWSLNKLFNSMGSHYDLSELPTVAYKDNKPIVFDGNRRILIGKIIHGYVNVKDQNMFINFDFPITIECNVCSLEVALEHVDRKHADSGSWDPLEKDIFKNKHMAKEKSPFLILEESTGIISSNPELNKRYVNEEIFNQTLLHQMGFSTINGMLKSAYSDVKDSEKILEKVKDLIINKDTTTRKNRGEIIRLLNEDVNIKHILNKPKVEFKKFKSDKFKDSCHSRRKTPIVKGKKHLLFGEKIILKSGSVNNIYSDLLKLHSQKSYSEDFPMITRMGLRLLCELAFVNGWEMYLKDNFDDVKRQMSQDEKNTLHAQNVTSGNIVSLMQSGAHGYTATNNIAQTVAISLVIGRLLGKEHGRE